MKHYTEAPTTEQLERRDRNETVWRLPDGSYAIGDDYDPADYPDDTFDCGTVGEWLEDRASAIGTL